MSRRVIRKTAVPPTARPGTSLKETPKEVPPVVEKRSVPSLDSFILPAGAPMLELNTRGGKKPKIAAIPDAMCILMSMRFLNRYRDHAQRVVCGRFMSDEVFGYLPLFYPDMQFLRDYPSDIEEFLFIDGVPQLSPTETSSLSMGEREIALNQLIVGNLSELLNKNPSAIGVFYRPPYFYGQQYAENAINTVFLNGVMHCVPYGTRYSTWVYITTLSSNRSSYQMNNYSNEIHDKKLSYYNEKIRHAFVYGANNTPTDLMYAILIFREYIESYTGRKDEEAFAAATQLYSQVLPVFGVSVTRLESEKA